MPANYGESTARGPVTGPLAADGVSDSSARPRQRRAHRPRALIPRPRAWFVAWALVRHALAGLRQRRQGSARRCRAYVASDTNDRSPIAHISVFALWRRRQILCISLIISPCRPPTAACPEVLMQGLLWRA